MALTKVKSSVNRGKALVTAERQDELMAALRTSEKRKDIAIRMGVSPAAITYHEKSALERYRKPTEEETNLYAEQELLLLAPRRQANALIFDKQMATYRALSEELERIREFDDAAIADANQRGYDALRRTDTSKLEQRLLNLADAIHKTNSANLYHSNRLAMLIGFDAVKPAKNNENTTGMLVAFSQHAERILGELPSKLEALNIPVNEVMQLVAMELHTMLKDISEAAVK